MSKYDVIRKALGTENPLRILAAALNGKKFGSNVDLEDKTLNNLNKTLAKNRLWDENDKWYLMEDTPTHKYSRPNINRDFEKVFGSYPPSGKWYDDGFDHDFSDGIDEEAFDEWQNKFIGHWPYYSFTEQPYNVGQTSKGNSWLEFAKDDPNVMDKCFDLFTTEADCGNAVRKFISENTVSDAFIPELERLAEYRAREKKYRLLNAIKHHNATFNRINVKRPQEFVRYAASFMPAKGTTASELRKHEARLIKNDALHRINTAWKNYYDKVFLEDAERDGVFLDPLMFTEDPKYGALARTWISGGDIHEVPPAPIEDLGDLRGYSYSNTEPSMWELMKDLSNRNQAPLSEVKRKW